MYWCCTFQNIIKHIIIITASQLTNLHRGILYDTLLVFRQSLAVNCLVKILIGNNSILFFFIILFFTTVVASLHFQKFFLLCITNNTLRKTYYFLPTVVTFFE